MSEKAIHNVADWKGNGATKKDTTGPGKKRMNLPVFLLEVNGTNLYFTCIFM